MSYQTATWRSLTVETNRRELECPQRPPETPTAAHESHKHTWNIKCVIRLYLYIHTHTLYDDVWQKLWCHWMRCLGTSEALHDEMRCGIRAACTSNYSRRFVHAPASLQTHTDTLWHCLTTTTPIQSRTQQTSDSSWASLEIRPKEIISPSLAHDVTALHEEGSK